MFTTKRNNVLADGGMMQEGGTVDEVSGNEVPVGSTKEEVRDDINAKLSVGEYVFPADVTRYYGIAKLEEMRKEAQEGLKQMESGGRMGNAEQVSEEAADGYDEAQFSKEVDEDMASYDKEQGFAEGGVVTYDPAVSKELYKRAPLKGFEMIPMSDDKGNTIYIPFINGKPQLNIPPGFAIRAAAPKVDESAATDSTTPTAPAAQEQRGGGSKAEQDSGGLGYSPTSGLTSPGPVSFQGNVQGALEGYGTALGGILPYAGLANLAAKAMLPSATLAESAKEQAILAANMAAFGPSYAGAGYGTSVADGGYGVTSMTGGGIAANPMGIDPATAQGQQAIKNLVSESIQLSIDKNIDPDTALSQKLAQAADDQRSAESARLAAREQAAREAQAAAEQSAAESARLAAKEQAVRDSENAARAVAEQAAREQAAREAARAVEAQMARDAAEQSDREAVRAVEAARDAAEQSSRERSARQQSVREQSAREAARAAEANMAAQAARDDQAARDAAASQSSGSQRGGESVGGYAAGSQAAAAAAAGTVGGYGPGTPGFNGGGGDTGD